MVGRERVDWASQRSISGSLEVKLMIPRNVRDRLILKEDDFAAAF
ncbi:hypothetical protein ACGFX8_25870 [Streptomyces sp. NPDC048362]